MNAPTIIVAASLLALAGVAFGRKKKEGTSGGGISKPMPTGEPEGVPETPGGEVAAERPMPSADDFRDGLAAIMQQDDSPVTARLVEKMYRLETANMTSEGYRATYTPGMKCGWKNGKQVLTFPYGWAKRGTVSSDYLPPVNMVDTLEGAPSYWVVFRALPVAMQYVAQVLRDRGYNPGAWNSTDPAKQSTYNAKLTNISTPLADEVWAEMQSEQQQPLSKPQGPGGPVGQTATAKTAGQ